MGINCVVVCDEDNWVVGGKLFIFVHNIQLYAIMCNYVYIFQTHHSDYSSIASIDDCALCTHYFILRIHDGSFRFLWILQSPSSVTIFVTR